MSDDSVTKRKLKLRLCKMSNFPTMKSFISNLDTEGSAPLLENVILNVNKLQTDVFVHYLVENPDLMDKLILRNRSPWNAEGGQK